MFEMNEIDKLLTMNWKEEQNMLTSYNYLDRSVCAAKFISNMAIICGFIRKRYVLERKILNSLKCCITISKVQLHSTKYTHR